MMEFYDFPDRKVNIFEPDDKNYFIKSKNFSYLCTYEETMSIDKRHDFPDAFILVVYKRYALVAEGHISYQNMMFADGHQAKGRYKEKGFVIISNVPQKYFIQSWNDYLVSYEIRNDEKFNAALNPSIYESAVDAVNAAIDMSKSNRQTYIITQWFDEFDRH